MLATQVLGHCGPRWGKAREQTFRWGGTHSPVLSRLSLRKLSAIQVDMERGFITTTTVIAQWVPRALGVFPSSSQPRWEGATEGLRHGSKVTLLVSSRTRSEAQVVRPQAWALNHPTGYVSDCL